MRLVIDDSSFCINDGCANERVQAEKPNAQTRTGMCEACIIKCESYGWELKSNGSMVRGDVHLLPSGVVRIDDHPNQRTTELLRGMITVEDLDEEELAMGMCKNDDGEFPLKAPSIVPKAIYDAMRLQLYSRVNMKLHSSLSDAVDNIVEIMNNPGNEPQVRLKAATYVLERILGKTPDRVDVRLDAPWQVLLDGIDRTRKELS